MTKLEVLNKVLNDLVDGNPDIKGSLIVRTDGLVIAFRLTSLDMEADVVAAISAAFLGLAKRAIKTLKCGEFIEVVTEGSEMSLRVYRCGERAVLAIINKSQTNIGLINLDAREAAEKIAQALG